ncbi:MAG TPA: cation transporting ATPase C-terminal domain-containing protein [Terriglobales bacterium]|nr:cation transporting ATPase C-terminal domain-containing protein [Terriglobales bacterium]
MAEGRGTFSNIRRFLTYALTINIAELAPFLAWATTRGHFPLALGVLQVLAVDLSTGIMPALALGAEPLSGAELSHPPRQLRLIDARLLWRAFGVLGPVEAAMQLLAYAVTLRSLGWHYGGSPPDAAAQLAGSGAAFLAILAGQMATAFSCRSATEPPWRTLRTMGRNRALLWAAAASSALTLAQLLGQRPPHGAGLWVALAAFPVMLIADAIYKVSEWTGRGGAATRPVAPGANPLWSVDMVK